MHRGTVGAGTVNLGSPASLVARLVRGSRQFATACFAPVRLWRVACHLRPLGKGRALACIQRAMFTPNARTAEELRTRTGRLLAARVRAGLVIVLAAIVLFAAAELCLQREHLAPLLALKVLE